MPYVVGRTESHLYTGTNGEELFADAHLMTVISEIDGVLTIEQDIEYGSPWQFTVNAGEYVLISYADYGLPEPVKIVSQGITAAMYAAVYVELPE